MHLEIDRVADEELDAIQDQLTKVLTDVRDAVEDWDRMHNQVDLLVKDIEEHPPPLPPEEVEQGTGLLRWLADNHFTFLGYREYALERRDGDEVLVAVPGTGFGILRADPARSARAARRWSPTGRATSTCWCWPRPTPARPCTGPCSSTTSA